jgi:hypothetical protein
LVVFVELLCFFPVDLKGLAVAALFDREEVPEDELLLEVEEPLLLGDV